MDTRRLSYLLNQRKYTETQLELTFQIVLLLVAIST